MIKNRRFAPLAALLMLSGSLVLTGCDDKSSAQQGQPPTQVGVVTVKTQPLNITNELPGRTNPYRIAEVRPQVGGIILKREFTEGGQIKAGESLYQIDPATYQAAYDSAKADVAKAKANANVARLTVNRYVPLLKTNYVSRQDYDNAVATAKQADATVLSTEAALETARINLAYTKVMSPIDGRVGKSNVTEGALVTAGQATALAVVQELDPIYVDVTQSSDEFLRLQNDKSIKKVGDKAAVKLLLSDGSEYSEAGTLEFSEVTVDETTGSITLRAVFPNPQQDLLPGMFVRARLERGVKQDAILVPQQGVTRNQRGEATVMLVNKEQKVESRTIEVSQAINDKWLVVSGLSVGDRIIVTGLQKIAPGAPVTATEYSENTQAKDQQAQATHTEKQ